MPKRYVPHSRSRGAGSKVSQPGKNLLADGDQLIQLGAQVLQIGGIDLTAFVGAFGVLVEVVAAHLEQIMVSDRKSVV